MRILLAPDSFKECMTAVEAAEAMARGVDRAAQRLGLRIRTDLCPIADGGEGTVQAIAVARNWPLRTSRVTGPLGEPVNAVWAVEEHEPHGRAYEGAKWLLVGFLVWFLTIPFLIWLYFFEKRGHVAVLEAASACGLELVPPDDRDPERASTYGVGELIKAALDEGATTIVLGIGGTATCDGGVGMLAALGVRFYDEHAQEIRRPTGADLPRLARIDSTHIDPHIFKRHFTVACDVENPLLGPRGAAAVFAPQKGATPDQVARLERGLSHLVDLTRAAGLDASPDFPGSGGAGGLGFALRVYCGAEFISGARAVLEAVKFSQRAARADLVLTGEGRLDSQSLEGKACVAVARAAAEVGVSAAAPAGAVEPPFDFEGGAGVAEGLFIAARAIAPAGITPAESIVRAPEFLESATERLVVEWAGDQAHDDRR